MARTYIIAEAGVNHNGSLERAKRLVEIAAQAGADAVKFQSFKAEQVITTMAPKAEYQVRNTGTKESQYDMLKRLELSREDHKILFDYASSLGIQFLSTPFDIASLELLAYDLKLPCIKIASGEVTNAPLLLAAARTKRQLILSTGMCTMKDIEAALGVIAFGLTTPAKAKPSRKAFIAAFRSAAGKKALLKKVTLLHCVTEYPAQPEDVNILAMIAMQERFGLPVGFSDHTQGKAVALAAVALGAVVIEKHFTEDKALPGPDHRASLSPLELESLVRSIRTVEKSLGHGKKEPAAVEKKNISVVRRSLVASRPVRRGEKFTLDNLTVKRPGTGVSPLYFWDYLDRKADRDYERDEVLKR